MTNRYFAADYIYKVTPSGVVYRWDKDWVESDVNLINMGATEISEADITIDTERAVYSTDKGRHFILVDSKHLYEFHNEQDAVEYAQRVNGK